MYIENNGQHETQNTRREQQTPQNEKKKGNSLRDKD